MTHSVISPARAAVLVSAADARALAPAAVLLEARRVSDGSPAHIDGASVAVLDRDLAGAPAPGTGRLPLPAPEALNETLAAWGIGPDASVIVYAGSPEDSVVATRAWFVLRHAGVADVRVLDGGTAAWDAAEAGADASPASTAPLLIEEIDADAAAALGRDGVLIDARPASAWTAGRIPGAQSAPGLELFRDGHLLPEAELVDWAAGLGATGDATVGAYCGGGVAASATVFALQSLGIASGLYVGSWSAWSSDPTRPVETA